MDRNRHDSLRIVVYCFKHFDAEHSVQFRIAAILSNPAPELHGWSLMPRPSISRAPFYSIFYILLEMFIIEYLPISPKKTPMPGPSAASVLLN